MVADGGNFSLENNKDILPVERKDFGGQKKDKKKGNYNESAVRSSESYQTFLSMLKSGETNREQLKSFAYPERSMNAVNKMFNGALKDRYSKENEEMERMAAQLLIRDIDKGSVSASLRSLEQVVH